MSFLIRFKNVIFNYWIFLITIYLNWPSVLNDFLSLHCILCSLHSEGRTQCRLSLQYTVYKRIAFSCKPCLASVLLYINASETFSYLKQINPLRDISKTSAVFLCDFVLKSRVLFVTFTLQSNALSSPSSPQRREALQGRSNVGSGSAGCHIAAENYLTHRG